MGFSNRRITYSKKEFAKKAFEAVNINYGYVVIFDKYFRPNEVNFLLGDASKAEKKLNWKPRTSFDQLVSLMVQSDLKLAEREKVLIDNNLLKPTWENPTI